MTGKWLSATLLLLLGMSWAIVARAEIYKCRDASGGIVYSDSACKGERLKMNERGSVTIVQTSPTPVPVVAAVAQPVATLPPPAPVRPTPVPEVMATPSLKGMSLPLPSVSGTDYCKRNSPAYDPMRCRATPEPSYNELHRANIRDAASLLDPPAVIDLQHPVDTKPRSKVVTPTPNHNNEPDPVVPNTLPVVKLKPQPDGAK